MRQVSFLENNHYDPVTGCWNWTGAHNERGYGRMRYLVKTEFVAMNCPVRIYGYVLMEEKRVASATASYIKFIGIVRKEYSHYRKRSLR